VVVVVVPDLGKYRSNVVVLAHHVLDVGGPELGDLVKKYRDVRQGGRVVVRQTEQISCFYVTKSFLGILNVLLQLVHQRRELNQPAINSNSTIQYNILLLQWQTDRCESDIAY